MEEQVFSKESLDKGAKILKRLFDGEPKNINPLKNFPEPEMRLFEICGHYFETKEELKKYCQSEGLSIKDACILEYFRNIAGRRDVIKSSKISNGRTMLYTVVDEDGYAMYNNERSIYRGEFIWEYNHGSISDFYKEFRDRGIVFENDIYAEIRERHQRIMKMCKEQNLFNQGKK